ncbi:MAG: FAD-dependent oxidoreductase [Phycisphaerales bacterium]
MQTRREFVSSSLGALFGALAGGPFISNARAARPILGLPPGCDTGALPLDPTRPLWASPLTPKPMMIGGMPFAPWFTGDAFPDNHIPFHSAENVFPHGMPRATERVKVAVVGGGLSGLTTAYLLRRFKPVVFELRERFGGSAQGEIWDDSPYSLGGAYVITPDPGTFLHMIYHNLGLHQVVRVDEDPLTVELNGKVLPDFLKGAGFKPDELPALDAYLAVVDRMANQWYPDVPFDAPWMIALDQKTFKQDIEDQMGLPVPPLLADAIQAYCYSSFGGGWEEISAASGWNFLAAEEFGRWVFPGGNAYMADRLWQKLADLDRHIPAGCSPTHVRGGCRAVDVRMAPSGLVQVTYKDRDGSLRAIEAERVVLANSKHIVKHMLFDLERLDPAKYNAMLNLEYRAYAVANVLLDREIERDFYDIFLLRDGNFPQDVGAARGYFRPTDALDGSFTPSHLPPQPGARNVLTFYWPLAYPQGRFELILHEPYQRFGEGLTTMLREETLPLLGLPESAVREIRMTRWGHALPLAKPGFIATGKPQELLRPFEGRVYFVNQDNWALPAVENCLFDAHNVADEIASDL